MKFEINTENRTITLGDPIELKMFVKFVEERFSDWEHVFIQGYQESEGFLQIPSDEYDLKSMIENLQEPRDE